MPRMVVIDAESESDNVRVQITVTIPASTPLYLQDQLKARLDDRANLLVDHLDEHLIEWEDE